MIYLDSSALVKLVVEEPESQELQDFLRDRPDSLVSSVLAAIEVPRALERRRADTEVLARGDSVLRNLDLLELDAVVLAATRGVPAQVRSLDAIHLASAMTLGSAVESLLAYDRQLLAAARALGLPVAAPGVRQFDVVPIAAEPAQAR